jgi:hypothetical protein
MGMGQGAAKVPEALGDTEQLNGVGARRAVRAGGGAGELKDGQRGNVERARHTFARSDLEETVIGRECEVDVANPIQGHVPQTATHGIADDQGADQNGAADNGPERGAEVRAGMEPEVAADEGEEGHGQRAEVRGQWRLGERLQGAVAEFKGALHPFGEIEGVGDNDQRDAVFLIEANQEIAEVAGRGCGPARRSARRQGAVWVG